MRCRSLFAHAPAVRSLACSLRLGLAILRNCGGRRTLRRMNTKRRRIAAGRGRDRRDARDRHPGDGRRPVALGRTAGSVEAGQVAESQQARQGAEGRQGAQGRQGTEVAVTVQGTVTKGTDEAGRPTYSVTAGGKTWELSAGPSWYWGDKNPLNAYVGKSVSIAGSTHAGETELDVETVDGTALRAPASRRGPAGRGSSARRTRDGSPGWPTASPARDSVARTPQGSSRRDRDALGRRRDANRESARGAVEAKAVGEQRASAPQGA